MCSRDDHPPYESPMTARPATKAGLRALFDDATMPEQIEALRRRHPKVVAAIEREASASATALREALLDTATAYHLAMKHDGPGAVCEKPRCLRNRAALAAQPAAGSAEPRCPVCQHPEVHHMPDHGCYCGCKGSNRAQPAAGSAEPRCSHGEVECDPARGQIMCRKCGEIARLRSRIAP